MSLDGSQPAFLPRATSERDEVDVWAEGDVGDVVEFVSFVRNVAAHPGRYVRDSLDAELGEVAFRNAIGITNAAFDQLYATLIASVNQQMEATEATGRGGESTTESR